VLGLKMCQPVGDCGSVDDGMVIRMAMALAFGFS
jgi:hypothetical protein